MGPVHFVILSLGRAGTSHVIAMLRATSGIQAQGEIFHPDPHVHIQPEILSRLDLSLRERDPRAFVDLVLASAPAECVAAGFKMWWNQSPEACKYILSNERISKIILDRPNRLASFASKVKAESTGIWNQPAGMKLKDGYSDHKIRFLPQEFSEHVQFQDRIFDAYRRETRGPTLEIRYEELFGRQVYSKCLTFLGINVPNAEPEGYQKLNRSSILSRFATEDIPTIINALDNIGHPEWAVESDEMIRLLETARASADAARAAQFKAEYQVRSIAAAKAEVEAQASALAKSRDTLLRDLVEMAAAKADVESDFQFLHDQIRQLESAHDAVLNSRSWRAMEPVRRFTTFVRSLFPRGAST